MSLDVEEGSIQGLIGPNGAGKTVNVNVITGYVPFQSRGSWNGHDKLAELPAHRVAGLGKAPTFQTMHALKAPPTIDNLTEDLH